jgi:hypothetical protein
MICSTGTALVMNFRKFFNDYRVAPPQTGNMLITNMSIAAVLFMLGGLVVFEAVRVWRMSRRAPVAVGIPVVQR